MKFFISSVIAGMEEFRTSARNAIESLGYEAIYAEQFPASSSSARVACLDGVRQADAVLLLCGERYGEKQTSGLSATHEEYQEAKERCPIFAFVQSNCTPEPSQKLFIQDVQHWNTGQYTNSFTNSDDLHKAIVRTLHQWALTQSAGSINSQEALERATALLPEEHRGHYSSDIKLCLALVGQPRQSILRPSQLEDENLIVKLSNLALNGENAIFTRREGTDDSIQDHALLFKQKINSFLVDEQGSVSVRLGLTRNDGGFTAIIQEDVHEQISKGLNFCKAVLHEIDSSERLTHITIVATITGASYHAWRSRAEHARNPNSGTMGMWGEERKIISLSPPHRSRVSLRVQSNDIADDLTTMFRRHFKR